jgi:hypothetical protein
MSRVRNSNSHVALAVGLAVGLAAASGCSGTDIEYDDGVDDGSRRGELIVYQADDFDTGTSRTTYALRDALGGEQPLQFDSDPKLAPGTPVKIWGNATGDTLRVTSFRRMPPRDTTIQSALIGAAPFAPRSFAFVLVDTGGGFSQVRWDGTNHDVTTDFLMGRLINDDDSLRNYYLGDSYQMQDITATVIGPLSYTVNGCDTSPMASALRPMVDAQGGPFQHYLWYYGTRNSSCSWSGLASVVTPQSPQKNTWYNQSVGCVVLVQEPGHNFGMRHSSSMRCPMATFVDAPEMICTHSEYGDSYDPMGRGCRHMNGAQKSYLGWFGKCNVIEVPATGRLISRSAMMATQRMTFLLCGTHVQHVVDDQIRFRIQEQQMLADNPVLERRRQRWEVQQQVGRHTGPWLVLRVLGVDLERHGARRGGVVLQHRPGVASVFAFQLRRQQALEDGPHRGREDVAVLRAGARRLEFRGQRRLGRADLRRVLGLFQLGVARGELGVQVGVRIDTRLEPGERRGVGVHGRIGARLLRAFLKREVRRCRASRSRRSGTRRTEERDHEPSADVHVMPPVRRTPS